MNSLSISPASGVEVNLSALATWSNPLVPVNLSAKELDVFCENAGKDRFGKDAKHAYAVASGKLNILRISRPTLDCRK
jgi:hypothetical protein